MKEYQLLGQRIVVLDAVPATNVVANRSTWVQQDAVLEVVDYHHKSRSITAISETIETGFYLREQGVLWDFAR